MSEEPRMTLYRISEEIDRLDEMMERTQGDDAMMTDEDRDAVTAFIDGLKTEANIKADGYAKAIREMESRSKARRTEASVLSEMATADQRRADGLKRFLLQCMERIGERQLVGQTFTLAVQRDGGAAPVEVFGDAEAMPERFVRVTKTPDRDAIRRALEQGDADAANFATLGERGVSLRIR